MAIRIPRPIFVPLRPGPLKPEERDLLIWLSQVYSGRPTLMLEEFLRDFTCGRSGQPMQRKTALNQIYRGVFPVPVVDDRILLRDVAVWLYHRRTKAA